MNITIMTQQSLTNYITPQINATNATNALKALIILCVLKKIYNIVKPKWNESYRNKFGRLLRNIPIIENEYQTFLTKETVESIENTKKIWKNFEDPILEIPQYGWSFEQITTLLNKYVAITIDPLKHTHTSGAIYTTTFMESDMNSPNMGYLLEKYYYKYYTSDTNYDNMTDKEYFEYISNFIDIMSTITFLYTNKMNPLHNEFKIGVFIEEQVISMVANYLNNNINNTKDFSGIVTSGGSESLMLAMRCYRNWGIETKNLEIGEPIVIVGASVHAAVMKASQAYNIRIMEANTDMDGNIDLNHLEYLVKKHNKYVVAIIGSSPSYPTGIIDNIELMGIIALRYKVGFHVDCCLGGFALPNNYANIRGITSISFDIHKFGLCTKGCSTLLCKKINNVFLNHYSIYTVPYWRGGVYGTYRDAGSYSAANALIALVTMLIIGKYGYRRQVVSLTAATKALSDIVNKQNKLVLINNNQINTTSSISPMITIKMNPTYTDKQGAIYAFADEMKKHEFIFSRISNDMIHFCLTVRFSTDPNGLILFESALINSLNDLQTRINNGENFNSIGGYGSLEYSNKPVLNINSSISISGIVKFVQNWFLGQCGANDAIRNVLMSQHFYNLY